MNHAPYVRFTSDQRSTPSTITMTYITTKQRNEEPTSRQVMCEGSGKPAEQLCHNKHTTYTKHEAVPWDVHGILNTTTATSRRHNDIHETGISITTHSSDTTTNDERQRQQSSNSTTRQDNERTTNDERRQCNDADATTTTTTRGFLRCAVQCSAVQCCAAGRSVR